MILPKVQGTIEEVEIQKSRRQDEGSEDIIPKVFRKVNFKQSNEYFLFQDIFQVPPDVFNCPGLWRRY